MEGFLDKKGRGKTLSFVRPWARRFCSLDIDSHQLHYFAPDNTNTLKGSVDISGGNVVDLPQGEKPHMFEVHTVAGEVFSLSAPTAKDKEKWMDCLKRYSRLNEAQPTSCPSLSVMSEAVSNMTVDEKSPQDSSEKTTVQSPPKTTSTGLLETQPYEGQKPGTSGLRKKTKVFEEGFYLHNFVQSTFNALLEEGAVLSDGSLLIGGDGRYYNDTATQIIIKIAVANGVRRIVIGQHGYLSTPAVSAIIRERGPRWQHIFGAFILTASHNPGGPEEDFGIKYNCENGGPAPESLTNLIYENTKRISLIKYCQDFPTIDIATVGSSKISASETHTGVVIVEVISSTEEHVNLLKKCFDFKKISNLIQRPDFDFRYDCMHGVQGPYAEEVFVKALGAPESCLINAIPKSDFNGGHADPNLTYARDICNIMKVDKTGAIMQGDEDEPIPSFGAAADGDADRNMILGRQFFVTPSDSLAIIAAHANLMPFFALQGGLKSVARSMPTSGAVDRVAEKLKLNMFEVPTGWKFFGNIMDSKDICKGKNYNPMICGEESFGTGSNHVREKDGMWAVLAWLSILAHYNANPKAPFVHVSSIVEQHWESYGRNFYARHDYEGVEKSKATAVMTSLVDSFSSIQGKKFMDGKYEIKSTDEFEYHDPIDGSISSHQGIRILFVGGSRVVFRLSGTAGSGATIRMYVEKFEEDSSLMHISTSDALKDIVDIALAVSNIAQITGMDAPTVIT